MNAKTKPTPTSSITYPRPLHALSKAPPPQPVRVVRHAKTPRANTVLLSNARRIGSGDVGGAQVELVGYE